MSAIDTAGTAAGLALTAGFWTFVAVYALTARWESTPVGRNLFTFALACALILSLAFTRAYVADHLALDVVRLVLYVAILTVVVRMTVLLIRTQTAARRARRSGHAQHETKE